jgi:uncharacterized protein (DUF362 family)
MQQAGAGAVATGAFLSAESTLALSFHHDKPRDSGKSRVVVARDAHVQDVFGQPIPSHVEELLDRAIAAYTGLPRAEDSWKEILGKARVIGIKTSGLGGKNLSSHAAVVYAIAARLQAVGIPPGNIIVWDRNAADLKACGLTISTDQTRMRCFGSDVAGFEEAQESCGNVPVHLSKILSLCDMVIGVPILKDHSMAGVTFAMKNMYGVIDRPQDLHGNNCCPAVADLNCIPAIRQKVRFTVGDALSSVYEGGPEFRPEHFWRPNALIVGEDRVAIDHTAWQILERKRAESGLPTLEAAGRAPRYIAVAADKAHALGTDDPNQIQLMEI